jgi:hypothetical protein
VQVPGWLFVTHAAACVTNSHPGTCTGRGGKLSGRVPRGAAGMTPEHRLAVIVETIRAIQIGTPVSKGLVALLLDPWPDLYRDAMARERAGWINLLQAAAARIERAPE